MTAAVDYTGQKFHKLTAIKWTGKYYITKGENRKRLWLFQCDCGKQHIAPMEKVKKGDTKSCGCLKGKYTGRDSYMFTVFNQGKSPSARKRESTMYSDGDMTFEQFLEMSAKPCFYCGKEPSNCVSNKITGVKYYYSGLDRLDNSRPHDFDNCVPCCRKHNTSKGEFSFQEWINDMVHVLKHLSVI